MEKTNTEDLMHPSMLQICYLSELAKIGKRRGSVGKAHMPESTALLMFWM